MRNPVRKLGLAALGLIIAALLLWLSFSGWFGQEDTSLSMGAGMIGFTLLCLVSYFIPTSILATRGQTRLLAGTHVISRRHVGVADWERFRAIDLAASGVRIPALEGPCSVPRPCPAAGTEIIVGKQSVLIDGSYFRFSRVFVGQNSGQLPKLRPSPASGRGYHMKFNAIRGLARASLLYFFFSLLLIPSVDLASAQTARFERLARQVDYLDDQTVFKPAWEALLEALPTGARIFSIVIEDKDIAVEVATGAGKLDRWTVRRARFLGIFDRDVVSGPRPVRTPAADFRAALFDLHDIALDRLEDMIDQAIQRAGLEDPARVTGIAVGSPQIILPSIHYGRLRFTLTVSSGRELATVFATQDGTIVAADLSQTNRAEKLDLLAMDDWPMQEAQEALTKLAGPNATIRTIHVGHKRIGLRQDNPTNPAAVDSLSWDLSGARQNPFPTLNPARDNLDYLPFKLSEIDFTKLPQVKTNAITAFNAAGATITDITAKKTLSPAGPTASEVMWHVTAKFPGEPASRFGPFPEMDELGLARVRADGTVVHVRLPRRMRKPIDWFSGEGMVATLRELREAFGVNARIQEVSVGDGDARITMEDPAAPGTSVLLVFDEEGLRRDWGSPSHWTSLDDAFTLSEFDQIGIEGVGKIVEETYRRAGVVAPPTAPSLNGREFSTKLCGSNGRGTPAGTPKLEIRINSRNTYMTYRFARDEYVADHDC